MCVDRHAFLLVTGHASQSRIFAGCFLSWISFTDLPNPYVHSYVQVRGLVSSHKEGFHWLDTSFWSLYVGLKLVSGRAAV